MADLAVVVSGSRIVQPTVKDTIKSKTMSPYTVFTIDVITPTDGTVIHQIEKRYRDFLALHRSLRAKFPEVNGLKFPKKKDPLVTFSKSTVEDRKIFFEQYLNALLKLKPRPDDVNFFLELDVTLGGTSKKAPGSGPSLDDFDLLMVLGKGAFGKVFLVRERNLDQLFAMKVLKKKLIIEKKQVEHTITERDVMGTIHHPFVAELRFAFQNKVNIFMVSDFCAGGELFFHLRRLRGFTEDLIRFYTAEVILALEHLHSLNIVYRDLKPENVLLDEFGHVKLTDFGLAKQDVRVRDGASTYCGTPEYLSPEMIRVKGVAEASYGFGVDYWAVGNLMYEMLTCRPPFYDPNPRQMVENILTSKINFPANRNASLALKDVIQGFLERDPAYRLGARAGGVKEIKQHAFFAAIDWNKLLKKEVRPPFAPDVKNSLTHNFDKCFTDLDPNISITSAPSDMENFDGPSTSDKAGSKNALKKVINNLMQRPLYSTATDDDEELLNNMFKDFDFTGTTNHHPSIKESEFENLWEGTEDDMQTA